jgi:hypothetical protein
MIHSSFFLYSSVPRNITELYYSVLKSRNVAHYIHRLTDQYMWHYIHRLTDIASLDECKIFVPDALFLSSTRPAVVTSSIFILPTSCHRRQRATTTLRHTIALWPAATLRSASPRRHHHSSCPPLLGLSSRRHPSTRCSQPITTVSDLTLASTLLPVSKPRQHVPRTDATIRSSLTHQCPRPLRRRCRRP